MKTKDGLRLRFHQYGGECCSKEWASHVPIVSADGITFYIVISLVDYSECGDDDMAKVPFNAAVWAVPILPVGEWNKEVKPYTGYNYPAEAGPEAATAIYEYAQARCLRLKETGFYEKPLEAMYEALQVPDIDYWMELTIQNSWHDYWGEGLHRVIGLTPRPNWKDKLTDGEFIQQRLQEFIEGQKAIQFSGAFLT